MTGTHPAIAAAVAALEARDAGSAAIAADALECLTGNEGPAALNQDHLQYFLWYRLPTEWPGDTALHRRTAGALADALDLLDLPRYAAICRSEVTAGVFDAYAHGRARGEAAWRRADRASGIVPPHLPEFRWGHLMGRTEAAALCSTTNFLELAVAAGDPSPGRGSEARRVELARLHLTAPRPELAGRSLLDTIHEERLGHWLQLHHGGTVWPRLLDTLAPLLGRPVALPAGTDDPLPPLRWLLEQLAAGQALTQTGNLNRALVRAAATRFGWWPPELPSLPNNENELYPLQLTHILAEQTKSVRRRGGQLTLSPRGRELLADPEALWRATAAVLLPPERLSAATGEAALALLVVAGEQRESDLEAELREIVADQGWHDTRTGARPDAQEVSRARRATTDMLSYLCLAEAEGRWPNLTLRLTPVGRATALEALHARALAPRS